MKTAIVLISVALMTPAWHYGKLAVSWLASNPSMWTKQIGYLPWFVVVSVASLLYYRNQTKK